MTGTPSRTARVPIARWDLKAAEGKIPTRGTRSAYEASPLSGERALGLEAQCHPEEVSPGKLGDWDVYATGTGGRSRVLPWEICHTAARLGLPRGGTMGWQKSAEGRKAVAPAEGPND